MVSLTRFSFPTLRWKKINKDERGEGRKIDAGEQVLQPAERVSADEEENAKDDEENRVEHIGWNRFLFGHEVPPKKIENACNIVALKSKEKPRDEPGAEGMRVISRQGLRRLP